MSREQIDEIKKVLMRTCKRVRTSQEDYMQDRYAEALYNAGYRKQSDAEQLVNDIFDEVEKCVIGTIEPSFIQLRDKYIAKMKGGAE